MKILLFALLAFPVVAMGSTSVTACGTLSVAGATYVLQNNVSAAGNCFTISANNVTLDLNGYTVTYDTTFQNGPAYGVTTSWNKSTLHITNGTFVQGAGKDYQSIAVNLTLGAVNSEVDHLTFHYQGDNNLAIGVSCSNLPNPNVNIHDNTIYPNGTKRADPKLGYPTHYGSFATIMTVYCTGTTTITNNLIQGKGDQGINVRVVSAPVAVNITHNTVSMAAPVRDAYAIGLSSSKPVNMNYEIAYNTITQASGRGIGVEGDGVIGYNSHGPGFGTIHDNTIDVREPCDSGEYPCPGDDIGIMLRGGIHDMQVYNNTVTVHAGADACPIQFPQQQGNSCMGIGLKIIAGTYTTNDRFYNNTVNAITTDNTETASGLYGDFPSPGQGTDFDHNTVTSNSILVDLSASDGSGNNYLFASNNFIQGANPQGFHSVRVGYCCGDSALGNILLDNAWTNASPNDFDYGNGGGEFSIFLKYYLTVVVKDSKSNPVAGATVTAASSHESVSGTTNNTGTAILALTDYLYSGSVDGPTDVATAYTPHTVTASKTGYTSATTSVTMSSDKSVTMQLGGSPLTLKATPH